MNRLRCLRCLRSLNQLKHPAVWLSRVLELQAAVAAAVIALAATLHATPVQSTQNLSTEELRERLADLHLPAEPAPAVSGAGWPMAVLVAIAVLLLALIAYRYHLLAARRQRHPGLAAAVGLRLQQLQQTARDTSSAASVWSQGNALLKEIALPLDPVALSTLHGSAWVNWLQTHCDLSLSKPTAYALAHGCYEVTRTPIDDTQAPYPQTAAALLKFSEELEVLSLRLLQLRDNASDIDRRGSMAVA